MGRWMVIVLFVLLAVPAFAGQDEGAVVAEFAAFDENGDGVIVGEEYVNGVKVATFKRIDKDGDEVIEWTEWEAVDKSPEAADIFAKMDKNKDKTIRFTEYSSAVDKYSNVHDTYVAYDVDGSGTLTVGEYGERSRMRLFSSDL